MLPRFAECGHSRMPVYRETLDQPLGFLHVKDLLSILERQDGLAKLDLDQPHQAASLCAALHVGHGFAFENANHP